VIRSEAALMVSMQDLRGGFDGLKKKVLQRLNECMDHFAKVHDAIDDHEHCLRHHAEEIENRGTKYDVLLCQNQLDQSVRKEEFNRETADIRKVITWNTNKIEGFALAVSGMNPSKGRHKRSSPRKLRRLGTAGSKVGTRPSSRCSSNMGDSSEISSVKSKHMSGGSDTEAHHESTELSELPPVQDSGAEEAESSPEHEEQASALESAVEAAASDPGTAAEDDMADFDEGESEEEDDGFGGSTVMRQQVEALSMGLVGLGCLTLREPKLGQNRDARLRQEKDLLEELQNLRHWITNRSAPAGWDPTKITTVALSCAHPRADEQPRRPLPQVPMPQTLLGDSRSTNTMTTMPSLNDLVRGPMDKVPMQAQAGQRRVLAAVPLSARAKTAGSAGGGAGVPLSARGPGDVTGGRILPPLQATGVAH